MKFKASEATDVTTNVDSMTVYSRQSGTRRCRPPQKFKQCAGRQHGGGARIKVSWRTILAQLGAANILILNLSKAKLV